MNPLLKQMRCRLAQGPAPFVENSGPADGCAVALRSAAVLIPMIETHAGWHLLFIRRAENCNDYHSGQVAFPGGRMEREDANPEATALRKAQEEMGIAPRDVDVLGRLSDLISTTNYRITPFVGVMPWPYPLRLAPAEVARAFTIPMQWLSDPDNREVYEHPLPSGTVPVVRYRPYGGELLWGATARMTVSLLQALAGIDVPDALATNAAAHRQRSA
ncbi:MAG: NUDIX hydrolase [Gammaproteobacteria bacterium]